MPFLLYSYLGAEIMAPFFASLLVVIGVLLTGRLMQIIDLILNLNIGFIDFIRLCTYIIPSLLLFSLPMAGTLGVIIAFTRMSGDNEIIALKASGLSLYRLMPPVVVFALATALFSGFMSTKLIPAGTQAMKNLMVRVAAEKIDKGVREKRFSDSTGDLVLYVDKVDPRTGKWQGVYISDLSDPQNPVTVVAKQGSLESHVEEAYISLDLEDGSMYRAKQEVSQAIEFQRYRVNLPMEVPVMEKGADKKEKADKQVLSQAELLDKARFYKEIKPRLSNKFLVEYHKRLVMAVGCFFLCLLGMPLALRSKVGRRNLGVPLGLGFFILYYVVVTAAKGACDDPVLPVGLIMWMPNVLFGLLTMVVLSITAGEKWGAVRSVLIFRRAAKSEGKGGPG